jgi:hypothetical protein
MFSGLAGRAAAPALPAAVPALPATLPTPALEARLARLESLLLQQTEAVVR